MACPRCAAPSDAARWCVACERAFDAWSRRHAADIAWSVLAGGTILAVVSMGVPLLGLEAIFGAIGAFLGVGTVIGLHRASRRRRRRQFLRGAAIPRAYLTSGSA